MSIYEPQGTRNVHGLFTTVHDFFCKMGWNPEIPFVYSWGKIDKKIKVMKALENIQNEAKVIVEQLAERQINSMKERYNQFQEWMKVDGNAIVNDFHNRIDMYQSAHKYIYMTQYKQYNRDLGQFELPVAYPSDYRGQSGMNYNKDLVFQVYELRLQIRESWEDNYREDFIGQNMVKLNRALAKHINNEMTARDIRVKVGGDGAEVLADVDGKLFKTFGTLCGGYVQCLHYRYRSSLK